MQYVLNALVHILTMHIIENDKRSSFTKVKGYIYSLLTQIRKKNFLLGNISTIKQFKRHVIVNTNVILRKQLYFLNKKWNFIRHTIILKLL